VTIPDMLKSNTEQDETLTAKMHMIKRMQEANKKVETSKPSSPTVNTAIKFDAEVLKK
jgi:hypothetical protein